MRKSNRQTSIAIVTRCRQKELIRCLLSINLQTILPQEIIIIDNDPQQSARKISNLARFKSLPLKYLSSSKNVPGCRNLALQECKTRYLGFVDDDCVLTSRWLENGFENITTFKKAYVLGSTFLYNKNNIFALAAHARDTFWKKYNYKYNQISEIFDTKNVILDLKIIKSKNLRFDEKCQFKTYDSADFDFGFQLKSKQLSGNFCHQMKLFHQETSSFGRFIDRAYARGYLAVYINDKWELNHRLINKRDASFILWLLRSLKHFVNDYWKYSFFMDNSFIKRVVATLLIKVFERKYVLGYMEKK
jgi:GT2 family glycosyltransferase